MTLEDYRKLILEEYSLSKKKVIIANKKILIGSTLDFGNPNKGTTMYQ
ncbi:MAG: hypothetical protein IPM48_13255 [Saprospiraceae bacterium]|nr:hypothetical protein [Saprospiraceae bacterium]